MDIFTVSVYVFVLGSFLGLEIISKVPPQLHTPLMSGTNAISGITLLGALLLAGESETVLGQGISALATFFATINLVGGYGVTARMLAMFRR